MRSLEVLGKVRRTGEPVNAQVFVKWQSFGKCAMIIDMCDFIVSGAYKACPFRLPTLQKLAALLRSLPRGAYVVAIDVANCCWSVSP